MDAAFRTWARREAERRPDLVRVGYHGSYARDEAGPGSDLDIVAIVTSSAEPFELRPLSWDLLGLPVPAEIAVYTANEWARMLARGDRFARTVEGQAVWAGAGRR